MLRRRSSGHEGRVCSGLGQGTRGSEPTCCSPSATSGWLRAEGRGVLRRRWLVGYVGRERCLSGWPGRDEDRATSSARRDFRGESPNRAAASRRSPARRWARGVYQRSLAGSARSYRGCDRSGPSWALISPRGSRLERSRRARCPTRRGRCSGETACADLFRCHVERCPDRRSILRETREGAEVRRLPRGRSRSLPPAHRPGS